MTIAYGQNCFDGLVLGADSLEDDGITKRNVSKIWTYEVQGEWGIAIASAGESDLAESFNDGMRDILGHNDFDEVKLLAKLRIAIRQVRQSYPDSQFAFLAAIYGRPGAYAKLFRLNDQSLHLGPVRRYQALGMGGALATFISSQLFRQTLIVDDGARLAAFILERVKEHANGCGGPTSMVTFCKGVDQSFRIWTPEQIAALKLPSAKNMKDALKKFWRESNPPARFDTDTDESEGGYAHSIKASRLGRRLPPLEVEPLSASQKLKDRR